MIKLSAARKNKVDLADYDYRDDIENRLLMSTFSAFDVNVLEEILHSSLKLDCPSLAAALEADIKEVVAVVDKLSKTGLLIRKGDEVHVDKERRKYFESQLGKFDEDFKPNLEFLKGLLAKVPIHILPVWYSIPRTSTNIFESIVEKYLLTPRVFQRYLLELNFGDPIIQGIFEDVFIAPDFRVRSCELREKYGLTRELFEEYMLHLEFNFLCCLSYTQIDGQWKEVVTPFHEWRQHLAFIRDTRPETIADTGQIESLRPGPFAFALDFKAVLDQLAKGPIPVEEAEPPIYFRVKQGPLLKEQLPETYEGWLLYKLVSVGLGAYQDGQIVETEHAAEWRGMSLEDVALTLYRHPQNPWRDPALQEGGRLEREHREVERSLQRVVDSGFVRFREFVKGVMAAIKGASEVTLQQVGRRWAYTRPTYTREQVAFICQMIFERFFEAGFVETGSYQDELCFRVTPFGRSMLSL